MQKLLLFVDKISTFVGQAFAWLIVALTLLITWEVFSRYALDAPARVGVRRDDHDVRHAVHDGRRVHAGEERPRARRRALRLLPAAAAGGARPHAVHRVLHPGRGRVRAGPATATPASRGRSTSTRTSPPTGRRSIRSRRSFRSPARSCCCRASSRSSAASSACKQGDWPSREEDVEEVDVDKLKEMVHVKDEDIAKLDKLVVAQRGRRANEKGSLVRPLDHGARRGRWCSC